MSFKTKLNKLNVTRGNVVEVPSSLYSLNLLELKGYGFNFVKLL